MRRCGFGLGHINNWVQMYEITTDEGPVYSVSSIFVVVAEAA